MTIHDVCRPRAPSARVDLQSMTAAARCPMIMVLINQGKSSRKLWCDYHSACAFKVALKSSTYTCNKLESEAKLHVQ